jgi:hypothetical protein
MFRGPPFVKQKALVIDQGFSYEKILSLISLKWSKVAMQNLVPAFPGVTNPLSRSTHPEQ